MAGQSINDRITAAKYSLAGQGLAKSVCKATTEEVMGPKKKHLDYLLQCTNEPNVSVPQLANLLIERSQMQSWVTVFKALITVHHLMCYGNERFTQYLASSNCNFNLGGFLDKTGTTATGQANQPQLSYDMSTFIRRYAKYINEKAISYRSVAFDFCKVKRGKDDGTLRVMPTDTLLKTLPILQTQLDALLDFDCNASELNNGVINSAFMLLFRDLIRLFACYNDGVINLLEKYFEMNKKQARDALDCYKKFLIRMDRVAEFLKVAEAIGMDKAEIPDLKQAPSSLLEALETHLASLEGKKISSSGSVASNGRIGDSVMANGTSGASTDEITKRAALAEEEALYEKLKQEHGKNNPFLSSPVSEPFSGASAAVAGGNIADLFGGDGEATTQSIQASKASDDLLQLGNPFADVMGAGASASPTVHPTQPYTNGFSISAQSFVSENAFRAVFGETTNGCTTTAPGIEGDANPFAGMGAPERGGSAVASQGSAFDGFGDILQPQGNPGVGGSQAPQLTQQPKKLISGDLDMSLSSLVENLNIKGPIQQKQQWNSPKNQGKTGGTSWNPPVAAPGGYRAPAPSSGQWPAGGQPTNQPFSQMGGIGGGGGRGTGPFPQQQHPLQQPGFDPFSGL